MEITILNKINWKINTKTPYEITQKILRDFLSNEKNSSKLLDVYKTYMDLLYFSLNEYDIYSNFNNYVISLTCLHLSLQITDEFNSIKSLLFDFDHSLASDDILEFIDNCKNEICSRVFS